MAEVVEREFLYTDADFARVKALIYRVAGIHLADNKKQLVYSRLARRLRALRLDSFPAYLRYLEQNPAERQEFINALTTNLTAFFREPHHFDFLRELARVRTGHKPLRVWCAAASTGEEPYSIAISLMEAFNSLTPPVEIVASDIDSQVLQTAALGVYDIDRLRSVSEAQKKRFFLRGKGAQEGRARVIEPLRQLVEFRQINLLEKAWGLTPGFDVIFCRNVMIYFDKQTQVQLLGRMLNLLTPEGFYIAGHSESFSQATQLVTLVGKSCYKRAAPIAAAGEGAVSARAGLNGVKP